MNFKGINKMTIRKITVLLVLLLSNFSHSETNIISNQDVMVVSVSREEIRQLYLMKKRRLYGGINVKIFQYPFEDKTHLQFVQNVLLMSVEKYYREVDKAVNAGLSKHIFIVKNRKEMLEMISKTHNGIGYVDEDTLIINIGLYNVKAIHIVD